MQLSLVCELAKKVLGSMTNKSPFSNIHLPSIKPVDAKPIRQFRWVTKRNALGSDLPAPGRVRGHDQDTKFGSSIANHRRKQNLDPVDTMYLLRRQLGSEGDRQLLQE
jgi:hypothetical protein